MLEHASVQGRPSTSDAVAELLPEEPSGPRSPLTWSSLVQQQLIRPDRSDLPGEDAFRFAHGLIREAAYQGLPKQQRAELHEHLARWLEARPDAQDETVGHHLGEAHRPDGARPCGERERSLAAAAATRLSAAAEHRAPARRSLRRAARLLERAEWLLRSDGAARTELLPALGATLFEAGRMDDATRVLDQAIAEAPRPNLRARAQVERELVRLETETSVGTEQARDVAAAVMPVLDREADDYGQSRAWLLRGQLDWGSGQVESADAAFREAAECARRAGDERQLFEVIGWRALAAALGPTPVDDAIARCEELRELARASPFATASTINPLAYAARHEGRLRDRRPPARPGRRDTPRARRHGFGCLRTSRPGPGCSPASRRWPRRRCAPTCETLSSMSEGGTLATTSALLAQAVYAQGRMDEAGELCRGADRLAAADDTMTHMVWRGVEAKVARPRRGAARRPRRWLARRSRWASPPTCCHTAVMRCSISVTCFGSVSVRRRRSARSRTASPSTSARATPSRPLGRGRCSMID